MVITLHAPHKAVTQVVRLYRKHVFIATTLCLGFHIITAAATHLHFRTLGILSWFSNSYEYHNSVVAFTLGQSVLRVCSSRDWSIRKGPSSLLQSSGR